MTLIAVAPDKYSKGFPDPGALPVYEVLEISEALERSYSTDAHLVAYVVRGVERQPRINKAGLAQFDRDVKVHALFADLDNPEHAEWTDTGRAAAREQETCVEMLTTCGIYDTRSGRRLVQPLEVPIPAAEVEPYLVRWLDELAAAGLAPDKSCKDWTRHYRLPNVVRDGQPFRSPYLNLERMRPIVLAPLLVPVSPAPRAPTFSGGYSTTEKLIRALRYAESVPPAIERQGGDQHTFQLCAKLVRGFDLTDGETLSVLRDWNARCSPPWSVEDLERKIANARRNGQEPIGGRLEARAATAPHPPREREPGSDDVSPEEYEEHRRFLASEKRRQVEQESAPKPAPEFEKALLELKQKSSPAKSGGVRFQLASELFSQELPRPLWLVRQMLPEQGVCAIAGEPKTTKTWCALELAMAIATATPAFGEFEVREARCVALFLAEDSPRSVRNRLRALAAMRGLDPVKACARIVVNCRNAVDLTTDEGAAALIAAARELGEPLGLLVLDPLRDLHSADENDSTEMAGVMSRLRAIREALGCSVAFIHHMGKSGKDSAGRRPGQRLRGSSAIHGAVDAGLYLSDLKTDFCSTWDNKVHVEIKAGAGAGFFGLKLDVQDDAEGEAVGATWTIERDGKAEDETRLKVLALLESSPTPLSKDTIRKSVAQNMSKVHRILKDLEKSCQIRQQFNGRHCIGWILTRSDVRTDPYRSVPVRIGTGSVPSVPGPVGAGTVDGTDPGTDEMVAAPVRITPSKKPTQKPLLTPDERARLLATPITYEPDPEAEAIRQAVIRAIDEEDENHADA